MIKPHLVADPNPKILELIAFYEKEILELTGVLHILEDSKQACQNAIVNGYVPVSQTASEAETAAAFEPIFDFGPFPYDHVSISYRLRPRGK